VVSYTSPSTQRTYTFSAPAMNFSQAELWCQGQGSHLASYQSLAEQNDTESYFIRMGAMLPGFHQFYWLGLNTSRWPAFTWLDSASAPSNHWKGFTRGSYSHWGYYMPQNVIEPNDKFPPENCAGANYSQAWGSGWGWADTNCSGVHPFMCKQACGCQAAAASVGDCLTACLPTPPTVYYVPAWVAT
jgi:hypothetical protein